MTLTILIAVILVIYFLPIIVGLCSDIRFYFTDDTGSILLIPFVNYFYVISHFIDLKNKAKERDSLEDMIEKWAK